MVGRRGFGCDVKGAVSLVSVVVLFFSWNTPISIHTSATDESISEIRPQHTMADTNPGNFANRPKEEVQAIASMGGKAAHEKVR